MGVVSLLCAGFAAGAGVAIALAAWATSGDNREAELRRDEYWKAELACLNGAHGRAVKQLQEQCNKDLWDLRERCAAYAEARINADEAAGFVRPVGTPLGMLIQCVPLRREDAPQAGKAS